MIAEGENPAKRRSAREIGEALGADYCMLDVGEHNNVTLVMKFGDFDDDTAIPEIIEHIQEER